jgi:hypothetical protein
MGYLLVHCKDVDHWRSWPLSEGPIVGLLLHRPVRHTPLEGVGKCWHYPNRHQESPAKKSKTETGKKVWEQNNKGGHERCDVASVYCPPILPQGVLHCSRCYFAICEGCGDSLGE